MQAPSYTDLDDARDAAPARRRVVCNAGTILLDALVNDRPTVCVLYDEGAPARRELGGEERHRRALPRARGVGRLLPRRDASRRSSAGIERALAHPDELAEERRRVAREVVGEVDGRAAERVVDAIADMLEKAGDET